MDICLERDRLLKLALEIEKNTNASVIQRDSLLIETVLKNAAVDIPEDAVFAGSFLHLNVMKQMIQARVEREEAVLREIPALKPHFAAYEVRAYTGLYDFGHTAPDWENIYRLGLPGLLRRLEVALETAATDAEREYCESGIRVWRAAMEYVEGMSKKAEELEYKSLFDTSQNTLYFSLLSDIVVDNYNDFSNAFDNQDVVAVRKHLKTINFARRCADHSFTEDAGNWSWEKFEQFRESASWLENILEAYE
jgi:hypothetical protein